MHGVRNGVVSGSEEQEMEVDRQVPTGGAIQPVRMSVRPLARFSATSDLAMQQVRIPTEQWMAELLSYWRMSHSEWSCMQQGLDSDSEYSAT